MDEIVLNKIRIINKNDHEVNWLKAINFIPKMGEIIIYNAELDEEGNILELPEGRTEPYTYPRTKIGDGFTVVSDLPFTTIDIDYSMLEFDTSLIVSGDPDAAWVGAATINTLKLGKN